MAQDVRVYSEFTRIDPFGQPVRADRGAVPPREILSPAFPRGAVSSFHVVVEGSPGERVSFQVAQNPENFAKVTAYREHYTKSGDEWIPDLLEPVQLPFDTQIPVAGTAVPGQSAVAFWVDFEVSRGARVRRVKIEPQVYIRDGWVQYPMEVRIREAALGGPAAKAYRGAADIASPSANSALAAWRDALCGLSDEKDAGPQPLTIRNFIARNAGQDVRFAGMTAPPQLLRGLSVRDRAAFCRNARLTLAAPEDYLRIRDALIGARE